MPSGPSDLYEIIPDNSNSTNLTPEPTPAHETNYEGLKRDDRESTRYEDLTTASREAKRREDTDKQVRDIGLYVNQKETDGLAGAPPGRDMKGDHLYKNVPSGELKGPVSTDIDRSC